jgi:hypothetical protein
MHGPDGVKVAESNMMVAGRYDNLTGQLGIPARGIRMS